MSHYKPIMEEALDEVKRKGLLRIQEKVYETAPDPLADLVARFSAALLEKLRAAEQKYGRKDDWLDPNWEADCQRQLLEHVAKGDPRDVAAYAAFCWHHGWPTNHLPGPPQEAPDILSFGQALDLAAEGFSRWKDKEHNAKWWRRIDGTPIPNDLLVNIAEVFAGRFSAIKPETPQRDRWPEIDAELTAYVQTIRAQLIEECAKEAARCDTHALFCMADPRALRSDIADRIRALALTRPQSHPTQEK